MHKLARAGLTKGGASGTEAARLPFYEGFGYRVLEAELCGTPVVCSNAGSLAEVGGNAVMTADPRDTEALALSLDRLLKDPQLREQLRRAGLVNARRFELECWRESHDRLYRLLLGLRSAVQLVGEEETP